MRKKTDVKTMAKQKRVLRIALSIRIPTVGAKEAYASAYKILAHNLNEKHVGIYSSRKLHQRTSEIIALIPDLTGAGIEKLERELGEIQATYRRVIVEMDKEYPYSRYFFDVRVAHLKVVQEGWSSE